MSFPPPASPPVTSLHLPHPDAYPGEPREYARALMQRKDEIEKEMEALKDVLSSHGTTASTPLIDPEGYPRGDLDIYAIRHARSALARLTTDRQTVNGLLATALEAAFSPVPVPSSSVTSIGTSGTNYVGNTSSNLVNGHTVGAIAAEEDMPDEWPETPLAKVNSVAPSSPAAEAGLHAGDMVHSFGRITAGTANGLQAIGALVPQSEGSPITILVIRDGERIRLQLTPRANWGGRGLLGCHILPA